MRTMRAPCRRGVAGDADLRPLVFPLSLVLLLILYECICSEMSYIYPYIQYGEQFCEPQLYRNLIILIDQSPTLSTLRALGLLEPLSAPICCVHVVHVLEVIL